MTERSSFPPADRDALGQAEQILHQAALDEGVALEAQYHTDIGVTDPDALVLRSMKHVVDTSLDRNDTPAKHPLEQTFDAIQEARVAIALEAFHKFITEGKAPISAYMTESNDALKSWIDETKAQMPRTPRRERFDNVAKFRESQMSDNLQRHKNIAKPEEFGINFKNNPYRNK